jgi:site-specific DNA-methyltransferase (adenine-specific)
MDISNKEKAQMIARLGGRKTPQLRPKFEPMVVAQKPREGTFVSNWINWGT